MNKNIKIIRQCFDGIDNYAVVKVKDPTQPMHGGNIEYLLDYTKSKKKAQDFYNTVAL